MAKNPSPSQCLYYIRRGYEFVEGKKVPLSPERLKHLQAIGDKICNRIKIVHKCNVYENTNTIRMRSVGWHNNHGKHSIDLTSNSRLRSKKKKIILKFVKKNEKWWEKFPEKWKCEDCSMEVTREQISFEYLRCMLDKEK